MAAPEPWPEVDGEPFRDLHPSRFITFTIPTPTASLLRAAVLDSSLPTTTAAVPKVAALLVPDGREADWIFSTEPGHRQLLHGLGQEVCRLILLGDLPQHPAPAYYSKPAEAPHASPSPSLLHLCRLLSPESAFAGGLPDVSFITYEDDLLRSLRIDVRSGPGVGDLLVEDVEAVGGAFRRRLRFKRMPNLVQTEVALEPTCSISPSSPPPLLGETSFRPKTTELVVPYLAAMASGLRFAGKNISIPANRPRVLCIGVGGGALPMFLTSHFHVDILGVEIDPAVLSVAKQHFGLIEDEFLRIVVGDGIELIKDRTRLAPIWKDCVVDVLMVDVDSSDAMQAMSAPPPAFLQTLKEVRSVVSEIGVVIVNVIAGDQILLGEMLDELRLLFAAVYMIEVDDADNILVLASASLLQHLEDEDQDEDDKNISLLVRNYSKLWKQI